MISYILLIPVLIIITLIVILLLEDLMIYLKYRKYYKTQGLPFNYKPIIGFGYYIIPSGKTECQLKDNWIPYLRHHEQKKTPMECFSGSRLGSPLLIIHDNQLKKDFFAKETEFCVRANIEKVNVGQNSFFLNRGHKAMRMRGIMADIFKKENMIQITETLQKCVLSTIFKIKQDHFTNKSKSEWGEINLSLYTKELFCKIVIKILVGIDQEDKETLLIPFYADQAVNLSAEADDNLFNIFTRGLANKLGLIENGRKAEYAKNKMETWVKKIYKQRFEDKTRERKINVIDLLISYNEKAIKDGRTEDILSEEEIFHSVALFMFAGIDTSQNTSLALLFLLAKEKGWQEKIREEINSNVFEKHDGSVSDHYDGCPTFEASLKEILRLKGPALSALFSRKAIKDFKLGKYKIKKGTFMFVVFNSHYSDSCYPDSMKFNPERFLKKEETARKLEQIDYAPFGFGQRACIGKYLGELMVKVLTMNMMKEFEFERIPDFKEKWRARLSYGIVECRLKLRQLNK